MMKIAADDAIPFLKGVLEPYADVVYLPGSAITRQDILDADALLTRTRTKCNRTLLEGTKVKFIASATIGMDHIDTAACHALGIRCVNAPGCNASSVRQYIVSLLLADAEKNHLTLSGKTIGVIGVGNVGKKVAEAAEILGMTVPKNDPPSTRMEGGQGFCDLDTVLKESDYITIHTPLNESGQDCTFHLANEDFFRKMKRKPFFINASRGPVVEQDALQSALITGLIRGAALDVWEGEPDISTELLNMLEFGTPHIAGYSADGKANGTAAAVRQLAEFFHIDALKGFYPDCVPAPSVTGIEPQSIWDAVRTSYDITKDDASLRHDPPCFESLRAHYPLRREFDTYTILNPQKFSTAGIRILSGLGFRLANKER